MLTSVQNPANQPTEAFEVHGIKMAEAAKIALQKEVQAYQTMQAEMQKLVTTRTQLQSQVNENEMVLEELQRLSDGSNVFKMIGPALIKQDSVEAKSNVNKRIEYIKGEIDRLDGQLKTLETKTKARESEILALQKKATAAA